jgi:hypothetical protein
MIAGMSVPPEIRGSAVLRDYPLRLWAQQREHFDSLLREFQLLLMGEEQGATAHSAPRQLVELADRFTTQFGPLIDALNAERQAALDRGLDRMDSTVPLLDGLPGLLDQVDQVTAAVDEYCASGDLLVLPRSPQLLALAAWTRAELVGQYEGRPPTPWPGPF